MAKCIEVSGMTLLRDFGTSEDRGYKRVVRLVNFTLCNDEVSAIFPKSSF